MHIVFGASALVMMIATLWLLAKDHNREWKDVQLTNRNKAAWVIQARHDSTGRSVLGQARDLRRRHPSREERTG